MAQEECSIDKNPTVGIEVFHDNITTLDFAPWLANAKYINLGATITKHIRDGIVLYQGLVTILRIKSLEQLNVRVEAWDWLAIQLNSNQLGPQLHDITG